MNVEVGGDLSVLKNHICLKQKIVKDVARPKKDPRKIGGINMDYNSNQT
jgi:hypothetical protein